MKLPGGYHEGEPAPGCDEEEKVATASSLEEEPGGLIKNKHMSHIPQDGENGQNVAFFIFLKLRCDQTARFFSFFPD